ncbi:MAG: hypothetical protein ACKVI3_06700 [Verrucomicrobiia bacterium]
MYDGKWQAVSGKLGTETIPLPETVLTIAGEGYTVDSPSGADAGDLVWGPEAEMRTMDMAGTSGPHQGSKIEALARVKGRFLQLCYAVDGSRRPVDFNPTQGTAVVTVRYRKIEPGETTDYASLLAEAEAEGEES